MTIATTDHAQIATQPSWRPFRVTVSRVQQLSPSFARITFTAGNLDEFGHDGPDQRVKLYLPRDGHELPELSLDWWSQYRHADPATRGFVRTYTIRAVRPQHREVDIDFALHGDGGPASAWARRATVGDEVALIGPNRLYGADCRGHEWNPPVGADDVLIAGDETALPAISGILASLRESPTCPARVRVMLEVPEPGDMIDLPAPEHAEVTWLPRRGSDGSAAANGSLLVESVCASGFGRDRRAEAAPTSTVDTVDIDLEILWEIAAAASSSVYAWIAGEAGAVKAIRRHLVGECGIDKSAVTFMGYWRTGRAEV